MNFMRRLACESEAIGSQAGYQYMFLFHLLNIWTCYSKQIKKQNI